MQDVSLRCQEKTCHWIIVHITVIDAVFKCSTFICWRTKKTKDCNMCHNFMGTFAARSCFVVCEDHKPDHETPEGQFCRRRCCCSEMTWLQHSFRPSTESFTLNQSYLWQWNLTLALSSCRAVCCQSCLHHTNRPSAYVLWSCVFFFFFLLFVLLKVLSPLSQPQFPQWVSCSLSDSGFDRRVVPAAPLWALWSWICRGKGPPEGWGRVAGETPASGMSPFYRRTEPAGGRWGWRGCRGECSWPI